MVNIPLKQYWELLVSYLMPQRMRLIALALLLFTQIGLQLLNPQIMRRFIDGAIAGTALDRLMLLAALYFGLALFQQVMAVGAAYTGEAVSWIATNLLRYDLARHCLHLDMSFHETRTPGELIERIDGDVSALANFFSQFMIKMVGNLVLLGGILVLLYQVDWRVGLVLTLWVLFAALVLGRLRNIGVPHWKAARQAFAELYGFLEERIGGSQDIHANGAQRYMLRRFYELSQTTWQRQLRAMLMNNLVVNATFLLYAIGSAAALMIGAYLLLGGAITIGTAYLVFQYTFMLSQPIETITQQFDDLQRAGGSIARVKELTGITSALTDGPGVALPQGPLAVEFDHVTFSYPGAEPTLHDVSFRLDPGKVLGLLGRTGSGKTTVTRLLLRLYDPQQGAVRLGDPQQPADLRMLRLSDLPRSVGMVTQHVQIFSASVRDNLTFFDRSIDDERILHSLDQLGLLPWFHTLPDGLDSMLQSGGAGLSAGEAQLLAFTRIFLKDPGLVILDEASSRLDPATEHLIERAIDRLLQDRTAIIIAHRLRTVERTDEIMILEHGRILEHGARAALRDDQQSSYAAMLRTGLDEILV